MKLGIGPVQDYRINNVWLYILCSTKSLGISIFTEAVVSLAHRWHLYDVFEVEKFNFGRHLGVREQLFG
jgi:hypothetical protein